MQEGLYGEEVFSECGLPESCLSILKQKQTHIIIL